ncbi:MAG: hypothetical protein JWM98_3376, partial [Thermoleophilia bacterium]|nr:hypothetical protein [Thermoleophilia bacterium]
GGEAGAQGDGRFVHRWMMARVSTGHTLPMQLSTRLRFGLAGAAAAAVWAAQQSLDKRAFRSGYDDVELLGRAVRPHGAGWRPAGWAMHLANGAAFGLAYSEVRRRTPDVDPLVSAQAMAQVENFGMYPLTAAADRVHPARDVLAPSFGRRQLAQATWRHALFGLVLGVLARRISPTAP